MNKSFIDFYRLTLSRTEPFLIPLVLTFLFISCGSSKQITSKLITQDYHNIIFSPERIQKPVVTGVEVTISPIDAVSINRETYEAATRDGNYEKELATEINKSRNELPQLSKKEREIIERKITAIDYLTSLVEDGTVPSDIANEMKMSIWYGEAAGRDGTEISSLSNQRNYSDAFNPYKINGKYLSVFKISFENKDEEITKIGLKNFQVQSGEELLYPLPNKYFEENLKNSPEKIKNIYRMNMPEELTITPGQKIVKFAAIPPINPKNKNLQIQILATNQVTNYDFQVSEQIENKSYELERYLLSPTGIRKGYNTSTFVDLFSVVVVNSGEPFATKGREVYFDQTKRNSTLSVYMIAIDKIKKRTLFSKRLDFKLTDIKQNIIYVNFGKNKRK